MVFLIVGGMCLRVVILSTSNYILCGPPSVARSCEARIFGLKWNNYFSPKETFKRCSVSRSYEHQAFELFSKAWLSLKLALNDVVTSIVFPTMASVRRAPHPGPLIVRQKYLCWELQSNLTRNDIFSNFENTTTSHCVSTLLPFGVINDPYSTPLSMTLRKKLRQSPLPPTPLPPPHWYVANNPPVFCQAGLRIRWYSFMPLGLWQKHLRELSVFGQFICNYIHKTILLLQQCSVAHSSIGGGDTWFITNCTVCPFLNVSCAKLHVMFRA